MAIAGIWILVAACGGAAGTASDSTRPLAGGSADPTALAPTVGVLNATPSPDLGTQAPTFPAAGSGHLVLGLGDSVVSAIRCVTPGCRSYALVLGDLAAKTIGPVAAINLGRIHDLGTDGLLAMIRDEDFVQRSVGRADVITIGVGCNDWQGPCHWEGHAACLSSGQKTAERNLNAVVDEITTLRKGQPTAIRLVTYADPYPGSPTTAADWGVPNTPKDVAAVTAMFDAALRDFNRMLCRVAVAHGGLCVDVLPAFNGPTGVEPIPPELQSTQAQQDLIASLIDATGYAPLR